MSRAEIQQVMAWIKTKATGAKLPFCWRQSYGRGVGTPLTACPSGKDKDAGLCYDRCKDGYGGAGPVCWQNCDSGWTSCAAGCGKTASDCAMTVGNQVIAPLVLAANIATIGLSTPATAGARAGAETIVVGGRAVAGGAKVSKALVKAVNLLQSVKPANVAKGGSITRRVYVAKTGSTLSTAMTAKSVAAAAYDAHKDYATAYADDFAQQTSPEISKEIDAHFHPRTARFLKETWAAQQPSEMAAANHWTIAQDVLGAVSIVDITGVTGVVSAYAKPICQDLKPFPCGPSCIR